jgi:hypothetical protein
VVLSRKRHREREREREKVHVEEQGRVEKQELLMCICSRK